MATVGFKTLLGAKLDLERRIAETLLNLGSEEMCRAQRHFVFLWAQRAFRTGFLPPWAQC